MKIKWFKNLLAFTVALTLGITSIPAYASEVEPQSEMVDTEVTVIEEISPSSNFDLIDESEPAPADETTVDQPEADETFDGGLEPADDEASNSIPNDTTPVSDDLKLVFARENANGSLTEIDCLVVNVNSVKRLVLAIKDGNSNLSLFSSLDGANEATITWTTMVNDSLVEENLYNDPLMETTGTYIDYDISSDLKTNFNRYYRGVKRTENQFITKADGVNLGQKANCYIKVLARNDATFKILSNTIPVTVLDEDSKATGDEVLIDKIIDSDEPEVTYQAARDALVNRTTKGFATKLDSLDMNRVFDFDAEREGMAPYEGDYLKFQLTPGLQQLYCTDQVSYKGQDYYVYKMTATMVTKTIHEKNVDDFLSDALYMKSSPLFGFGKMTTENRIKAVYDYVTSLEVEQTPETSATKDTAYGLLFEKSNSSMAYALTFYRFCRETDVAAKVLRNKDGSAFNLVKFDDAWYFVDCSKKLYKKTAAEFDYSKIESDFNKNNYYSNYIRQTAGYTVGKGVNVKNSAGTIVYSTSNLLDAKNYVKEELDGGRANPSTLYTIAFESDFKIDSLDGSGVNDNIEFDLENRSVTIPSTVNKFIINGRVKNGSISCMTSAFIYPGSSLDANLTTERLYTCNLDAENSAYISTEPIKLNGKVTTKYLSAFYGLNPENSSDTGYSNFYVFANDLTVTNETKLARNIRLLVGDNLILKGKTFICNNKTAKDNVYKDEANDSKMNSIELSAYILMLKDESHSASADRLSIMGVLDESDYNVVDYAWNEVYSNVPTTGPLAIIQVEKNGEGFDAVAYEAGEKVATLKDLKVIGHRDGLTNPVPITCSQTADSNLANYLYVLCERPGAEFDKLLQLEKDGVLWYKQSNVYYELYYTGDNSESGNTQTLAELANLINSKKKLVKDKKTYTLTNIKIYLANDEKLTENLSFGTYPVELATIVSKATSTNPVDSYGFINASTNVNIDILAYKLTSGKLTIGEGLTLKSTAAKNGTLQAAKGIELSGNLNRITVSNNLSIQSLGSMRKAVELTDVTAINGLTLTENSRVLFLGKSTIAKVSNTGKATIYKANNAEIVINSITANFKYRTVIGLVNAATASPNADSINGKYNVLDFTERTKLFTTKLSGFPVGRFALEHPFAGTSDFNALVFDKDGVYTAYALFSLKVKSADGAEDAEENSTAYSLWKDILVDMNQKEDYEVTISGDVDLGKNPKLPTKAKSVKLIKNAECEGNRTLKAAGTINLTCDLELEGISLEAPLATLKINAKKLTLTNSLMNVSAVTSAAKGGLTLANSTANVEKSISLAGKNMLQASDLVLKNKTGNLSATGETELFSSTIESKGRVTLGNIYSDDDKNTIIYALTLDKKKNPTGAGSIIKGFISDSRSAAAYRSTVEFPYGDATKLMRSAMDTQKLKVCAINLVPMNEEVEYTKPDEGFPLISAAKASAVWFVGGMTLSDNHLINDRILNTTGNGRYPLSKVKNLLVVGTRVEEGNLLLESGYAGTYAIEGYYNSLADATKAIDTIADKTRDYRITIFNDEDKVLTSSGKNLSLPSKLDCLEITSTSDTTQVKKLYFGKSLALKSNLKLNKVMLVPSANYSISTGNFALTLDNVELDPEKNITSITGSKVTGNSGLILKNTSFLVMGKVDKLGRLELNGSSLKAYGVINIGELVNDESTPFNETLTGLATINKKGVVSSAISINGATNPKYDITIKLNKKEGTEYIPITFTDFESLAFAKAPRLGTSHILVDGLSEGYLAKKGANLTFIKGTRTDEQVTLNYENESLAFASFDEAVAEINSQKYKRDYVIKITGSEGTTTKKLATLKITAKKYQATFLETIEHNGPIIIVYPKTSVVL